MSNSQENNSFSIEKANKQMRARERWENSIFMWHSFRLSNLRSDYWCLSKCIFKKMQLTSINAIKLHVRVYKCLNKRHRIDNNLSWTSIWQWVLLMKCNTMCHINALGCCAMTNLAIEEYAISDMYFFLFAMAIGWTD